MFIPLTSCAFQVLIKHCNRDDFEDDIKESFKDVHEAALESSLVSTSSLDLSNLEQDCQEQVMQDTQLSTVNLTCCMYEGQDPQHNISYVTRTMPARENDTVSLMPCQTSNEENNETKPKSTTITRICPPAARSVHSGLGSTTSGLVPHQRSFIVSYCTHTTNNFGKLCVSESKSKLDDDSFKISKSTFPDTFHSECRITTSAIEKLMDRKLNGPESSMSYFSKAESGLRNDLMDEKNCVVYQLKSLNVESRNEDINDMNKHSNVAREQECEMIIYQYFNVETKDIKEEEFFSVHPVEDVRASTPNNSNADDINNRVELNRSTRRQDLAICNPAMSVQNRLRPFNGIAYEIMDLSHTKMVLRRVRNLLNIRQDFTSRRWIKLSVNPAPRNNQPRDMFGSQEGSDSDVSSQENEANNYSGDVTLPLRQEETSVVQTVSQERYSLSRQEETSVVQTVSQERYSLSRQEPEETGISSITTISSPLSHDGNQRRNHGLHIDYSSSSMAGPSDNSVMSSENTEEINDP